MIATFPLNMSFDCGFFRPVVSDLWAVDCPVTPYLLACSERLENRMLRACCEIVSSLTHRNITHRCYPAFPFP